MKQPEIRIETLENQKYIYIRFRGSYLQFRKNSRKLFNQLFAYAKINQLIEENVTKVLTIYNDNPYITEPDNLRTSIAMTISSNAYPTETDEISVGSISGKFLVGRFELSAKEYGDAWNTMYQDYIFNGLYASRDAIPFELYVSEPPRNLTDSSITDIYIPIL